MNTAKRLALWCLPLLMAGLMAGCTTVPKSPLQAHVASVERMEGESMETRLNVRLRVTNPNDTAVEYKGASAELLLQGKVVGSGVSPQGGTIARYSDVIIPIPVTVSGLGTIRQATGLYGGASRKLDYTLTGRFQGNALVGDLPFRWQGELALGAP